MKITVLVFWGILYSISAFKLEDPKEPEVIWIEQTGSAPVAYIVENNDGGRVNVTLITEVLGEIAFHVNANQALADTIDLRIENGVDSTQFYLTANLLDYDVLKDNLPTVFGVDIIEDSDLPNKQTLIYNIQNLDDESPTLSADILCVLEEETVIDVNTSTCIFDVSDPDGWLNLMDYSEITGSAGESDLFEFKYLSPPADDVYQANVYLVLKPGQTLDYETITFYTFHLNAKDRAGHATAPLSSIPVIVQVKDIIDINNSAPPTITNTEIIGLLNENSAKGYTVVLEGKDADEGDSGRIKFVTIKEIKRYIQGNPIPQENTPQDLFSLTTADDYQQGILTLDADNLRGYYGYLVLTISLTDLGTPPLTQDVDVSIEVGKYNFEQPLFLFPDNETRTQYLLPYQNPNNQLILFDGGSFLKNIKATDQQDDKFGVKFLLLDDGGFDVFDLEDAGNSEAQLQLNSFTFLQRPYTLTIMAYNDAPDNTPGSGFYQNTSIKIDFFNVAATDPVFMNHEDSVTFPENLNASRYQVESAFYPKPDLPDGLPIYYLLREGDHTIFDLNVNTGMVTLLRELDYEAVQNYSIVIQSSNSMSIKPDVSEESKFYLTVNLVDVVERAEADWTGIEGCCTSRGLKLF